MKNLLYSPLRPVRSSMVARRLQTGPSGAPPLDSSQSSFQSAMSCMLTWVGDFFLFLFILFPHTLSHHTREPLPQPLGPNGPKVWPIDGYDFKEHFRTFITNGPIILCHQGVSSIDLKRWLARQFSSREESSNAFEIFLVRKLTVKLNSQFPKNNTLYDVYSQNTFDCRP